MLLNHLLQNIMIELSVKAGLAKNMIRMHEAHVGD